jgi:hypothetical protein
MGGVAIEAIRYRIPNRCARGERRSRLESNVAIEEVVAAAAGHELSYAPIFVPAAELLASK